MRLRAIEDARTGRRQEIFKRKVALTHMQTLLCLPYAGTAEVCTEHSGPLLDAGDSSEPAAQY